MTVAVAEQLYCAKCSDPVESVDEDGYGRCCHNLPNPWHRGSDGLYTRPSASADADEEDDTAEDDVRPRCAYCGGRRFTINATEWRRHVMSHAVTSLENEIDDSTLWYERYDFEASDTDESENFSISGITCTRCNQDVSSHVHAEES